MQAGAEIDDNLLPQTVAIWQKATRKWGIADTRRLGSALLARLRTLRPEESARLADCGGGLLERLIRAAGTATDYESLCRAAATKKYTDGRIRRALLYVLSGVAYADLEASPTYLRLLGANEKGRAFLAKTKKTRTVPVVTKQSDIVALGESAARQRALAAVADGLYALCLPRNVAPTELSVLQPVML